MPLSIGDKLGPYEILAAIGAGGMGEVYRARDPRLDRDVAIKVSAAQFSERFEREAKAIAALNHPHICQIYDVGPNYLVMEYISGTPLKGPFPLEKTLEYAGQIAGALDAAHAKKITHRDLKPANILVTRLGVKLLDFGLARIEKPVIAEEETLSDGLTVKGQILGTLRYMSPEQVNAQEAGPRSDIFSFGLVLYEMLTGKRAFEGATPASIMGAILERAAPSVSDVAPAALDRVLKRCLEKDPENRWQSARDLKAALELVASVPQPAASIRSRPLFGILGWIAAGVLAIVSWFVYQNGQVVNQSSTATVLTRLTYDTGLAADPDISPNGTVVAFASDRSGDGNLDIWVQSIPRAEPVRLTRHAADDRDPVFSPDGSHIAFHSDRDGGGIWAMPALGGAERLLARLGRRPRYSPDGKWLAYHIGGRGFAGKIYLMPAAGGPPVQFLAEFGASAFATWSPDGKRLLFTAVRDNVRDFWVAAVPDGNAAPTGAAEVLERYKLTNFIPARWVAEGNFVIFSARLGDSTNLWRIAISPQTGKIAGDPERLTTGTGDESQPALSGSGSRMVFSTLNDNLDIWGLPVDHAGGRPIGPPQQFTTNAGRDYWGTLSSDGKKLSFLSDRIGNADVWLKDLETGQETRITSTPGDETSATISPDGSHILYVSKEASKSTAYQVPTAGGAPQKVAGDPGRLWDWSPDGSTVILGRAGFRFSSREIRSGREIEFLKDELPAHVDNPRISADGRWVAFMTWNAADRGTEWIAPLPPGPLASPIPKNQWIQITDGRFLDIEMALAPDGNRLYFASERDGFLCLWTQRLDPSTRHPVGAPIALQHFHTARHPMNDIRMPMRLSTGPGKLSYELHEITGNIWLADFETSKFSKQTREPASN